MAGRRTKYWVKCYDIDGNFKGNLKTFEIKDDVGFQATINSGLQQLDIQTIATELMNDEKLAFHNQIEIHKFDSFTGSEGEMIYAGKMYVPKFPISKKIKNQELVMESHGIIADLANTLVEDSIFRTNWSITADTGTIMANLVHLYRAKRSSISLDIAPNDNADTYFGALRLRAQTITTEINTEQNKVIGAEIKMLDNPGGSGAYGDIMASIWTDGLIFPAIQITNWASGPSISNSSGYYFKFYFDAEYQLSNSTVYWLVWGSPTAANNTRYITRYDNTNPYGGGTSWRSDDGGGSWVNTAPADMTCRLLYVDESRVRLNAASIDLSGRSITLDLRMTTFLDAFNQVIEKGPANFYFYIDKYDYHYHKHGQTGSTIQNCDDSTAWAATNCTLSDNVDGAREGISAIQMDFGGGGAVTTHTMTYIPPVGFLDLTGYQYCAPEYVYLPTLSGIDYLEIGFMDAFGIYNGFQVPVEALAVTLEYAVPLDEGYHFLLDKVDITRDPDASTGIIDWTSINEISFTVETTTGSIGIDGILVDNWRLANLNHHNVIEDKECEIEGSLNSLPSEIRNAAIVHNNQASAASIFRLFENQESINRFYKFEELVQEDGISSYTEAQIAGNSVIRERFTAKPQIETFKIKYPYNTDSIKPGHTITVKGIHHTLGNLVKNLVVTDISRKDKEIEVAVTRDVSALMSMLFKIKEKQQWESNDNIPSNYMP